jgi:hypothetical protein
MVLLVIDQKKVEEELAATERSYTVTSSNLDADIVRPYAEPAGTQVYSTVEALPADSERSRARLLALRQRIIDSGVQPLSPDDLDRCIDETRGR